MRQKFTSMRTGWRTVMLTAVLIGALVGLGGCVTHHHQRASSGAHVHGNGPPPHAPAHGHRYRHHDGIDLVYDAKIGVYAVVDHTHHFHDGQNYFRWIDGRWMMSVRMDRGWVVIASRDLPPSLGTYHAKKHKKAMKQRKAKKRDYHRGHPANQGKW